MRRLFELLDNRTVQICIGTFYMIALPAVLALFLHQLGFEPLPLIIIEILVTAPVTLLVERLLSSSGAIAIISANDLKFSIASSLILIAVAVAISFQEPGVAVQPTTHLISPPVATTLYFLLGLVLGATLRRMLDRLITRALFGRRRFIASLSFTGLWFLAAIIALLPVHTNATSPYLWGVGVGFLLNSSLAWRLERAGAAYRRLFEVQSGIPKWLRLSDDDRTALRLLARGRSPLTKQFTALNKHITDCKSTRQMTKCLRLVSACAARLESRYADAIEETAGTPIPPTDSMDAQLLLIRALSLEDKGDTLDAEIDSLLKIVASSDPGRACPLTRALQARRAAESAINAEGIISISKEPLLHVVASLDLRRGTSDLLEDAHSVPRDDGVEFFRSLIAHGVPVTPSWLLDVFGYALLIAGCPEEGRVFLQRCISLDPAYSYGYLHLGDYFLFRRTSMQVGGNRANPGESGSWHAEACYKFAMRVERNDASRVKRMARERLKLLATLQGK